MVEAARQTGDEASGVAGGLASDEALARYEAPLIRYAVQLLGDVEQARDVVQDTFVQLCRADPAEVGDHLSAWLYSVCRNRSLDILRKERRMHVLDAAALDSHAAPGPA